MGRPTDRGVRAATSRRDRAREDIPERNVVIVMRCGYKTDEGYTASIHFARLAGRHVRAIDTGGGVMLYPPLVSSSGPTPSAPTKKPRSKASMLKGTRPVDTFLL